MTSPRASRLSLLLRLVPALLLATLATTGGCCVADPEMDPALDSCDAGVCVEVAPAPVVIVDEERCHPRREVVVVEHERRCEPRREVVYAPRSYARPAPCAQPQHNAITWNPSPARAPSNTSNHNVTDNRERRH